jgi:DNA-binding transcriptional MerR regulator
MKTNLVKTAALCFGISTFSQAAQAKDIVSLGELRWMLKNGYSQATIDEIIEDCVADPDCGFGPVAPPNPDDDRIRKHKMQLHQQNMARGTLRSLPQTTLNRVVTDQKYQFQPRSRTVTAQPKPKKRTSN